MDTMKNRFRHAQRSICAPVQPFLGAPVKYAWFPFEHFPNSLLTQCPELRYLDNRVVPLAG